MIKWRLTGEVVGHGVCKLVDEAEEVHGAGSAQLRQLRAAGEGTEAAERSARRRGLRLGLLLSLLLLLLRLRVRVRGKSWRNEFVFQNPFQLSRWLVSGLSLLTRISGEQRRFVRCDGKKVVESGK